MKDFHTSSEWSKIKVYLLGIKLTERSVICSPLHVLGAGTESSSQGASAHILSVFIVHETTAKVGQWLKGCWLRELSQKKLGKKRSFTTASKEKYKEIHLIKEAKYLYNGKCETVNKDVEEGTGCQI